VKKGGRINSLNVVPIRQIYERWVGRFEELWASHLLRLKEDAEAKTAGGDTADAQKRKRPKRARLRPALCLEAPKPTEKGEPK
jgi:hypothetical protein